MIRRTLFVVFLAGLSQAGLLPPVQAAAETLVPTRPIRANSVLSRQDLAVISADVAGALRSIDQAVGLEARVTLYPGRAIHPGDLGPAAVVDRNQIVTMIYENAGLTIVAEGRALDRAGPGERIRVMNIDSRSVITGLVDPSGKVKVNK